MTKRVGTIEQIWRRHVGSGPLIARAIHDAHDVRDEVAEHLTLADADRLREEDPFTGEWTQVALTRAARTRSRFQVDLNRPREKAVYRTPDDAWVLANFVTAFGRQMSQLFAKTCK